MAGPHGLIAGLTWIDENTVLINGVTLGPDGAIKVGDLALTDNGGVLELDGDPLAVGGDAPTAHAASHEDGGGDAIDGPISPTQVTLPDGTVITGDEFGATITSPSGAVLVMPVAALGDGDGRGPTPDVVSVGAAGATEYDYAIVVVDASGRRTRASLDGTNLTGFAALDGTHKNRITWAAVPGAAQYEVLDNLQGTLLATLAATAPRTFDDDGTAGTNYPYEQRDRTGDVWLAGFAARFELGADGTLRIQTDNGVNVNLDPTGSVVMEDGASGSVSVGSGRVDVTGATGSRVTVLGTGDIDVVPSSGKKITLPSLVLDATHAGFFAATPVVQPALPTDTTTIIAALVALGLVAAS